MTKTLEMTFRDSLGKEVTITLPNPRSNLTLTEVQTVMQDIITKNAIIKNGASMLSVKRSFIREVTETELA